MTKKGITLIELIVVLVIGAITMGAITSIVVISYNQWGKNKDIVLLHSDFDLACYMIKGILEEASNISVYDSNTRVNASYKTQWEQELYPDPNNSNILLWKNKKTGKTQSVITDLNSIKFYYYDNTFYDTVLVNLSVRRVKTINGSFVVCIRNSK